MLLLLHLFNLVDYKNRSVAGFLASPTLFIHKIHHASPVGASKPPHPPGTAHHSRIDSLQPGLFDKIPPFLRLARGCPPSCQLCSFGYLSFALSPSSALPRLGRPPTARSSHQHAILPALVLCRTKRDSNSLEPNRIPSSPVLHLEHKRHIISPPSDCAFEERDRLFVSRLSRNDCRYIGSGRTIL